MAEEMFEVPLLEDQREALTIGLMTVKEALLDKNNPFLTAVANALGENELEKLHPLIEKCLDTVNHKDLFLHFSEFFSFYILLDLTKHIFASDYFLKVMKDHGFDVALKREGLMHIKNMTHAFFISMLEGMKNWETNNIFAAYIENAQSFPDLMTGISPKLAAYNHIPKIPDNPPQFDFRHYDADDGFIYNIRVNPYEFMKDLNCLMALLLILKDVENPPAKVLTAYFPDFKSQIMNALNKIMIKDKRRKKVELTAGEYGLLYACTDLFGRLRASSYNKLINKIEKGTAFENVSAEIEDTFPKENDKSFIMPTVELSLQRSNKDFGDCAIIKDYRAFTAQMIGFDD